MIGIDRAADGHFELVLEGVRELFAEASITRIVETTRAFLQWGTRHPQLPIEHLVQLVRSGRTPHTPALPEIAATVPLPGFVPAEGHLWQAAADQLSLDQKVELQVDDAGRGQLATAPRAIPSSSTPWPNSPRAWWPATETAPFSRSPHRPGNR